jgi:hypothetical protein
MSAGELASKRRRIINDPERGFVVLSKTAVIDHGAGQAPAHPFKRWLFAGIYVRTRGKVPHAYFNWAEGNPLLYLLHYVLSGEGDVAR